MARIKRAQQLEFLEAVPMFRGLAKKHLVTIARMTEQVTVPADRVLVEQGEPGDAFYLIVSGSGVVRRNGRKIAELSDGDFFGEMALIDGGPRSATVTTLEETTLFTIHRKDFASMLTVPAVARKLLEGLSERLREADRQLIS